jgi:Holliday junction resolvasome RuvABC DNA-binding subunit
MKTKIVRYEIDGVGYDVEVEDTTEQDIADKEALLLQMYQELQELKNRQ